MRVAQPGSRGALIADPFFKADPDGGYDLADRADRAFAFDYEGIGKLDHLVFYRPGTGDMTSRVAEIATAVGQISTETEKAEHEIAEVASVAEQSSAAAEQVSASTEQTSASTQEIAASAQTLAGTAEQLNEVVRRFKVAA
jgi:hypothetical protein